jgi:hypothetical protein
VGEIIVNEEHESHQPTAASCEGMPKRPKDYETPDYDMIDSEEDIKDRWPELESVLCDCANIIYPAYERANSRAIRNQTWHKWLVFVAAMCGMLAVLFAILSLAAYIPRGSPLPGLLSPLPLELWWVRVGELIAAFLALVAVIVGLVAAFFQTWLSERENAERCRVLKFLFLISPELWSGATRKARKNLLRTRVEPFKTFDKGDLERWERGRNKVLKEASSAVPATLSEDVFMQLLDYYRDKRLCYQKNYFCQEATSLNHWEWFTRTAPVVFFFLSIVAALVHFGIDEVLRLTHSDYETASLALLVLAETASLALLMLAACLPVVGVAVRTLHTAHEFGRNALRFESYSADLEELARELEAKSGPQAKLGVLHRIEDILGAERREWIRLMKVAEWFG